MADEMVNNLIASLFTPLFSPVDGYQKLLFGVFGLEPHKPTSLEQVLEGIVQGLAPVPLTEEEKELITEVVGSIPTNSARDAVQRLFGIRTEPIAAAQLAQEYGLTTTAIYTRRDEGLKRLRLPDRMGRLGIIPLQWRDLRANAGVLLARVQKLEQELELCRRIIWAIREGVSPSLILPPHTVDVELEQRKAEYFPRKFEEFDLGGRLRRCLQEARLLAVCDLYTNKKMFLEQTGEYLPVTCRNLIRLYSFGDKTLRELGKFLEDLGLPPIPEY